jgi:hypothetical protein
MKMTPHEIDRLVNGKINALLLAFTRILDVLNPLRNRDSVAHPNDDLLE